MAGCQIKGGDFTSVGKPQLLLYYVPKRMALSPTSKIENNDSEVFSYEKKVNAGSNVSYPTLPVSINHNAVSLHICAIW